MSVKAGAIVIDINAGTAKFLVDMDRANAQLQRFGKGATDAGHATVSSMQASSAAIRMLENPMGNNIRSVERFITLLPGMGTALRAAFPLVGALAFGDLIIRLGKDVVDFFHKIEQAPERLAGAFRELNAPLKLTNDELALVNQRLSNDIAKLEGKPANGLAEALLAAKVAADKLADSLDKDLDRLHQVMAANRPGWYQLFTPNTDKVDEHEFGKTGMGGFRASIAGAGGDPQKELALFKDDIKYLTVELGKLENNVKASPGTLADYGPAMERIKEYISQHQAEIDHIGLTQEGDRLNRSKDVLEGDKAQRKAALEETLRLTKELGAARAAQADALARIDIEQANELGHLKEIGQATKQNVAMVAEIYDTRRVAEYNKLLEETGKGLDEAAKRFETLSVEAMKIFGEGSFGEEIKAGSKMLEEHSKSITKWAEEQNRLTANSEQEGLRHGIAMTGAGDPLGKLRIQQALEALDIEAQYEERLRLANDDLDRSTAIRQKNLDLQKLQNQYEEAAAEIRRQRTDQALDLVSGNLTKLITGEHTSWGRDLQQTGRQVTQAAIKSALQQALAHFTHGHKPTGTPGDPVYVNVQNWPNLGGGGIGSIPGDPLPAAIGGVGSRGSGGGASGAGGVGGILGGILGAIFGGGGGAGGGAGESVTSSISFGGMLADGGDVVAGNNYIVGDGGEPEIFSPGMSGAVTPVSKLGKGGDNYYYTIDARGTDPVLTERRVRQAIVSAHNSAVATSIQAMSERAKRTVRQP